MPILELPNAKSPLCQGDVLKGINLFTTNAPWSDGSASRIDSSFAMVLSRPCALAHKKTVVVAQVVTFRSEIPPDPSFAMAKSFLDQMRDGLKSPDLFYLGQLPPDYRGGRHAARLDSLHTVSLPEANDLPGLLLTHRVATLNDDFTRDLHVRLFNAVARLGFEDYGWLPMMDLEWITQAARQDHAKKTSELSTKQADYKGREAAGFENEKHKTSLQREIANLESDVKALTETLKPYEAEIARRHASASDAPG